MSNWFSASFMCQDCGERWDELVERERKDEEHTVECEHCGLEQTLKRGIGATMTLKASFPDGHRRKNDERYQRVREAMKIKREAVNKPIEKRADHYREINSLRKTRPKDKGKE